MSRRMFFVLTCLSTLALVGCGSKRVPVNGTVTMDGKAVAGASVVFTSEDGKVTAAGQTDESGNFALTYLNEEGVPPGSYKVTVAKTAIVEGQAPGDPAAGGDAKDYTKEMKGRVQKAAPPGPVSLAPKVKETPSLLPQVYANSATTPLKVTVPAPDNKVTIELKAKP
jgi:hypothetical protein